MGKREIPSAADDLTRELCLVCGLCCNGVLFKDVQLQAGDDVLGLRERGLPVAARGRTHRFAQPCAALEGCVCRIYEHRPTRCRQFECLLFSSVLRGQTRLGEARRLIERARQRAERVRRLLRELGEEDEGAALSVRFRRVRARFEKGLVEEEVVRFGDLTLAVQDLNVLLSEAFYR